MSDLLDIKSDVKKLEDYLKRAGKKLPVEIYNAVKDTSKAGVKEMKAVTPKAKGRVKRYPIGRKPTRMSWVKQTKKRTLSGIITPRKKSRSEEENKKYALTIYSLNYGRDGQSGHLAPRNFIPPAKSKIQRLFVENVRKAVDEAIR